MKPDQRIFVGVVAPIDPHLIRRKKCAIACLKRRNTFRLSNSERRTTAAFAPFSDDTSTPREVAFAKIRARVVGTEHGCQDSREKLNGDRRRSEEELLKSAALQTANAVLIARRRAEQELVEIKEAFERKSAELTHSLLMMNAHSGVDRGRYPCHGRKRASNYMESKIPRNMAHPIGINCLARTPKTAKDHRVKQFTNPKAFRERIAEIYMNEPEETFDVLETIDGKVFERYSKIQCVEERNVGRVWSFRDITERKQAQKTEAHLAAIVESSDDAIISKDLNSIITSWNRGAERLFGYTAQEAIGQPVTMLMPPERFDEEVGILERIRRGESIDHYETVRRRKDGTLLQISLTVSPMTDRNGRIVGASKIARDISERKQAEVGTRTVAGERTPCAGKSGS